VRPDPVSQQRNPQSIVIGDDAGTGEPESRSRCSLRVLQFLQTAQIHQSDPGNGE
jgi:hypothetical protein